MFTLMFAAARSASAQDTTGAIAGRIVDPQGLALPGVSVLVKGPQGSTTTTTDSDGRFSVPFLTPGSYSLRATLTGFKALEIAEAVVELGRTVELALPMTLGALTETVVVITENVTVNPSTTTVGAVIDTKFAASVPIGRRVIDLSYMVPGVSNSGSVGRSNPSIAGGTGLDNHYVIDGVNVTNQGYGALGSFSVVFGSLGNATPFDFIKAVQVKTGGYDPEFGQAMGGVVNVVTKSGSNTLAGSVFSYGRPSSLEAGWRSFQSVNGTVQTLGTRHADIGAEAGGPLRRNRLFLFAATDAQWDRRTVQAPDGSPLRPVGGVAQLRHHTSYAVKPRLQLPGHQSIEASFFGDPSEGPEGPQRISALLAGDTSAYSSLEFGGHNQSVRYNVILTPHWLVEAGFARAFSHIGESPSTDAWHVVDYSRTPAVVTGGVGFFETGNRSTNRQWTAKASQTISNHEIRYGFTKSNVDYSQVNRITGPSFVADDRTTAGGAEVSVIPDVTYGRIYRVTRALLPGASESFEQELERTTTQSYMTFFAQDVWKVTGRLTITPGLRYERETMSGLLIHNFSLHGNWAPRVGVAYDPTGRGRTKIFGSVGRFFARVPNDLAARSLSPDETLVRADYFDAALTRPIPNGTTTRVPGGGALTSHLIRSGATNTGIDLDARLSYTDEVVIGVEQEVRSRLIVGAHYVYRKLGRALEDVARAPVVYYDQNPSFDSVRYVLTNPNRNTETYPGAASLGAAFDDPVHRYDAVDLTVRRSDPKWSVIGSYQWSRLRGNYEGFYRDDNGQADPAMSSLFDFPTNDPSYSAVGAGQFGYRGDIRYLGQTGTLPLDRPHQFKIFGNYVLNSAFSFGLALNFSSGKPLTALAAQPIYSRGGEVPETQRGAGFSTVDGMRTRSPFESQVDVHAAYERKVGGRYRLTLLAEIFNLFNERRALGYDAWTERPFGISNPDFGKPVSQLSASPLFQPPIAVRLGARFAF